jgi:UDP-N-acetyl-L-fucosamine synthase
MNLKVITVVGTRPEIIRLSRVMSKLDDICDHVLVHTGQNYDYELNEIFFDDLNIRKPDFYLKCAGQNASQTIGKILMEMDKLIKNLKPDAFLVLGDTNSSLSSIVAKKNKIPIFHMEAGNRCFDSRVPEEINRKIVDHISDINLTYSSISREYLLREGISPDSIIKVGSPMREVLDYYSDSINKSKVLDHLKISNNQFYLVSAHREENIDNELNFKKLIDLLNHLASKFNLPIIVSTHPRTRIKINNEKINFHSKVKLLKPLSFNDYNKLQKNAKVVLSDSGTITEESSILNFPALNIRENHERPEGMEEAAVMMVGMNIKRVDQAFNILNKQGNNNKIVDDYNVTNVSEKIVKIIHSYTDYVNRIVWKKL